jgi:hypothetical protein
MATRNVPPDFGAAAGLTAAAGVTATGWAPGVEAAPGKPGGAQAAMTPTPAEDSNMPSAVRRVTGCGLFTSGRRPR